MQVTTRTNTFYTLKILTFQHTLNPKIVTKPWQREESWFLRNSHRDHGVLIARASNAVDGAISVHYVVVLLELAQHCHNSPIESVSMGGKRRGWRRPATGLERGLGAAPWGFSHLPRALRR